MNQVDTCRDCGEPIFTTPLTERLGLRPWRCNLCDARFMAGYSSIVLAVVLLFSNPGSPWSWACFGVLTVVGASWFARCFAIAHKGLASRILSRGIVCLLLVACAYGIFTFAWDQHGKAVASLRWPQCSGKIVASCVQSKFSPKSGKLYYPSVEYEYLVGAKSWRGNLVSFNRDSQMSQTALPAEQVVQKYGTGASVRVSYNPEHPEMCCLEPGGDCLRLGLIAVCSLILLFCAALVCALEPAKHSRNVAKPSVVSRFKQIKFPFRRGR